METNLKSNKSTIERKIITEDQHDSQFEIFSISDFINITMKYNNNIFRIYEADLNIQDKQINKSQISGVKLDDPTKKIILLEFKFINFERIEEVIVNIQREVYYSSLTRKGYVYIKEDLIFYIVYELGSSTIFEINKKNPFNHKVIKMQIFLDLLTSAENMSKTKKKLGILHPNLIVFTPVKDNPMSGREIKDSAKSQQVISHIKDNPFNLIDTCWEEIVKTIDF